MKLHPEDQFIAKIPDRIIRSVFTVGTAATISQVLLMLYSFVLARWLGPEKNALIVANYSLCAISSILINFGLDVWLLRDNSKDHNLLEKAGHVIAIKAGAGIIWGLLLLGLVPEIRPNLYVRSVLIFAILDLYFNAMLNVLYIVLFKDNRFKISASILINSRLLRILSAITLMLFKVNNIYAFITIRVLIEFITLVVTWVFVKPKPNFQKILVKKNIFTQSAPYTASEVITVIHNQSDVNLVSFITNNLSIVSYFSVAINLVNAVFAIIMTLQSVFIPSLARLFDNKSKKFKKSIVLTILVFLAIGLILWVGATTFGERLIEITMGKEYSLSGIYLERISPIFIIRSLTIGVTIIIISINQQKIRLFPQGISTFFKIILGAIVLKQFNIDSYLWVYMLSEMIMLIGLIWLLLIWFNKKNDQKNIQPEI